jgi:hypothetical protein
MYTENVLWKKNQFIFSLNHILLTSHELITELNLWSFPATSPIATSYLMEKKPFHCHVTDINPETRSPRKTAYEIRIDFHEATTSPSVEPYVYIYIYIYTRMCMYVYALYTCNTYKYTERVTNTYYLYLRRCTATRRLLRIPLMICLFTINKIIKEWILILYTPLVDLL